MGNFGKKYSNKYSNKYREISPNFSTLIYHAIHIKIQLKSPFTWITVNNVRRYNLNQSYLQLSGNFTSPGTST